MSERAPNHQTRFWVVLREDGTSTTLFKHATEASAEAEAELLAAKALQRFFVLESICGFDPPRIKPDSSRLEVKMQKLQRKALNGYTLVELLVVVAGIGVMLVGTGAVGFLCYCAGKVAGVF
jgi:hypothetical protein